MPKSWQCAKTKGRARRPTDRPTDPNEELVQRSINGSHGRIASFMLRACIYKELAVGIRARVSSSLTQVDKNMLAAYLGTTRLPLPWSPPLAGRTDADADADVQALRMAQWCMLMPAFVWTSKIYSVAGPFPPSRSRAGGSATARGRPQTPVPFIT